MCVCISVCVRVQVYLSVCLCVYVGADVLEIAEEEFRSSEAGVTGGCELYSVGTGKPSLGPLDSRKLSLLQSHLSSCQMIFNVSNAGYYIFRANGAYLENLTKLVRFSKVFKGKAIQDKIFLGYEQFFFMKLLSLCYALKNKVLM